MSRNQAGLSLLQNRRKAAHVSSINRMMRELEACDILGGDVEATGWEACLG